MIDYFEKDSEEPLGFPGVPEEGANPDPEWQDLAELLSSQSQPPQTRCVLYLKAYWQPIRARI